MSEVGGRELSRPRPGRFNPVKISPVPIGEETMWALEPVWLTRKKVQSLIPIGNRAPIPRSFSL
jgi:hypothetical protein